MARETTQSQVNCKVKLTIYNTIFLYSKEEQITAIGIRLLEIELVYDKEQDIIILNQKSY